MYQVSALIPSRFLIIIGHLITSITIFWSRENNVEACLPLQYTAQEYNAKDSQLIVGLSIAIALITFELFSFICGVSMFAPLTSLISIFCHAAACISLFYFVFDSWDCDLYWWIFGLCSILPVCAEMLVIIQIVVFKKGI